MMEPIVILFTLRSLDYLKQILQKIYSKPVNNQSHKEKNIRYK